ncbi:MAG TPA: RtcB family protein [Dehalococcoidia bacterium]|nr:RtcB family protein [Dehalococcoidia bacterium]
MTAVANKDWKGILEKVDDYRWLLPKEYKPGMRVPGLIFSSEAMLDIIGQDQAIEQVANVAFLPGIVKYSMAMPDIHWGYGFPIGGVAAMRVEDGVVSPGGVGFDINCGTRVLRTDLMEDEVRARLKDVVDQLFRDIPAGIGGHGLVRVGAKEMDEVLVKGARWAVEQGYGWPEDAECIEGGGALAGANPDKVSKRAKERGGPQLGTLGSGNHFLEVQVVDEVFDAEAAAAMGITGPGQVLVFIHSGSRGLGHQTCTDYLDVMEEAAERYDIHLPDKQLACAPIGSKEGRDYLGGMTAAANFAFCNRQLIAHWTRQAFQRVFGRDARDGLGMHVIYDVAHNIAKIERHHLNGREVTVCVHRKGATRAFPPGHPDIPARYQKTGQPVLVPGDMGRYSYIATGTEQAMAETWGSTCHGAGRVQSRHAAKRMLQGVDIARRLGERGIYVRAQNRGLLAEEASEAYKDVAQVVDVLDAAGIARKVCRMRPMGVVKG